MAHFGKSSTNKLATCDEKLQTVMNRAIMIMDFSVVWGHRGEEAQNEAFDKGHSRKRFPDSKHNGKPSMAIDIAPWVEGTIPWNRVEYFYILAGVVKACAAILCIEIRWGGDWDGDGNIVKYDDDERLNDLGHFEIVG